MIKQLTLAAFIIVFAPALETAFAAPFSPPPFIHGSLACAKNVNKLLHKAGRRGTNSASSLSFLRLPRTSNPRPFDVVFNSRGKGKGHVQVYAGRGMCWNPSSGHGWRLRPCNSTWENKRKIFLRTR